VLELTCHLDSVHNLGDVKKGERNSKNHDHGQNLPPDRLIISCLCIAIAMLNFVDNTTVTG